MSYVFEFSETALADIEKHKKAGDKAVLKKIERLLNELMEHPAKYLLLGDIKFQIKPSKYDDKNPTILRAEPRRSEDDGKIPLSPGFSPGRYEALTFINIFNQRLIPLENLFGNLPDVIRFSHGVVV